MMSLAGAVIAFDLDGTLVDTAGDLVGSVNQLLVEEGLPPVAFEDGRRMIGGGVRALVDRVLTADGAPRHDQALDAAVDRYTEIYRGRIALESRPYPGVVETLDRLRAEGARLAVCTNKRTPLAIAVLDALDLTSRFAAVVGADLIAHKPDPRILQLAIERAGGSDGRALSVGDSMADQATARAAGVPVVGVTYGYVPAPLKPEDFDALIDRFEDLPPIAERLIGRGA
jgi:phosphoglycolate phosphatase